jgi:hypothetical protein
VTGGPAYTTRGPGFCAWAMGPCIAPFLSGTVSAAGAEAKLFSPDERDWNAATRSPPTKMKAVVRTKAPARRLTRPWLFRVFDICMAPAMLSLILLRHTVVRLQPMVLLHWATIYICVTPRRKSYKRSREGAVTACSEGEALGRATHHHRRTAKGPSADEPPVPFSLRAHKSSLVCYGFRNGRRQRCVSKALFRATTCSGARTA